MQRKDNNRNKLDVWAHDIYISIEPDNLVENIIENVNRYIKDIIKPYSIIITRRKTEVERKEAYYLLSKVRNYSELEKAKIEEKIKGWKNIAGDKEIAKCKRKLLLEKLKQMENWKSKLFNHFYEQNITDDMLLFKLYKDQIKDNQTIIITDKYSAGYFKSLHETMNDISIMDTNSTQSFLRSGRKNKNDSIVADYFTKLEELIAIPNIEEKNWTVCAVRLSWFDEFIGTIGIIFKGQPSYKSFSKIIDYLHKVKRSYSEEIMRLILKKAKGTNSEDSINNFDHVIYQCIDKTSIFKLENNDQIKACKDPLKLLPSLQQSEISKFFHSYFKINDFEIDFALPIMTISEKKMLPILLRSSDKLIVFLETNEKYTNDKEKLKKLAENNTWKLGWLWRNYHAIK